MMFGYAVLGHFVGDYLIQNDWMALNKKSSSFHCAVHCALWALAVCAFSGWWGWYLFLFITHYMQDRTNVVVWYMKRIGQEKFMGPPCGPWSIIVVDNVFHVLVLALVSWCVS